MLRRHPPRPPNRPVPACSLPAMKIASGDLRDWLERDVIAEAFDAALQVGDGAGLLDLIEIGFSEFMIGDALGEHVIGGNQDFVSDGEGRAHGAAAALRRWNLSLR